MKIPWAKFILGMVAAAGTSLTVAGSAQAADPMYHYTLNTSLLDPSDSYYLYFQLDQGTSGIPNSVTVDSFSYGGGEGLDVPATLPPSGPNESGSVSTDGTTSAPPTTLTLDDTSGFFNAIGVAFNPGSTLDFTVDSTTNNLADETQFNPDEFSFAILDSLGNNLATTAPDASNNLIELTLGYPGIDSPQTADFETYDLIAKSTSSVPLPLPGEMALLLTASLFGWSAWRKATSRRLAKI